jgi:DNA-binding NarL/FixJ family response regulator
MKLVLADDHTLFRNGMALLLKGSAVARSGRATAWMLRWPRSRRIPMSISRCSTCTCRA